MSQSFDFLNRSYNEKVRDRIGVKQLMSKRIDRGKIVSKKIAN